MAPGRRSPPPPTSAMAGDTGSCISHLECGLTGERHDAGRLHNLSTAGKPLLVRYDLERLARSVTRDALLRRPPEMWRYREFLPIRRTENIVALGECTTPLVDAPRLARRLGGGTLLVKDEGRLPTGSFKARGL